MVLFFFSKFSTQSRKVCFAYVSYIIKSVVDNDNSFESSYNPPSPKSYTEYDTELG